MYCLCRIQRGYLCNEYDANMVINQKLSWDDIDEMVALKGHGEGCGGVSNGKIHTFVLREET